MFKKYGNEIMLVTMAILLISLITYTIGLRQNVRQLRHELDVVNGEVRKLALRDVTSTCVAWWTGNTDLTKARASICSNIQPPKTKDRK